MICHRHTTLWFVTDTKHYDLLQTQNTMVCYRHQTLWFVPDFFDWLMIAYIALFSALLSRITALAFGSTWVTSFISLFFFFFFKYPPKWCTLQRWHGWCHMKLQPSRRKSCVHRTTMHHVTSCKATYVRCMRVLAVTCHLHSWQNDRGLLRATAVTRGWNGYRNKSQHRKSTLEKEKKLSRHSSRDSNPQPFNHESGALTTELSPLPLFDCNRSLPR